MLYVCIVFVFKQKTAYEMRISDWSSDVCSSDLVASQLQAEVRRLGGNPEDDSSLMAAAHHTFMNLKQAFTGNEDKAIIEEVERGEDYIKAKFEAALTDRELMPSSEAVIREAYTSVRAGHDRASALKHSMLIPKQHQIGRAHV